MKRLIQLDLLRVIAVALVMFRHMAICPPEVSTTLHWITTVLNRGGWIGVDMFFVLSGFLISGLLFREYQKDGTINIRRFLVRRAFKIYPSFWLLLAVTLISYQMTTTAVRLQPLLGELLFLQNYIGGFWSHTWSLAVEEHFYIGLALLFFLLLRFANREKNCFRLVPHLFIFIFLFCFIARLLTTIFVPFSHGKHVFPTHLRIDSLFFGVLLSYYWYFGNLKELSSSRKIRTVLLILGTLLLLPAFVYEVEQALWIVPVGLGMFALGSGCLLLSFLGSDFSSNSAFRYTAYIGTFSYSLYLWHLPLNTWLFDYFNGRPGERWLLYFCLYFSLSLIVGIAASKLVEYPFLKIRDRFFPTLVPSGARPVN